MHLVILRWSVCALLPPLAGLSRLFVFPSLFSILPLYRSAYASDMRSNAVKCLALKCWCLRKSPTGWICLVCASFQQRHSTWHFADSIMQFHSGQSMLPDQLPTTTPMNIGPPTRGRFAAAYNDSAAYDGTARKGIPVQQSAVHMQSPPQQYGGTPLFTVTQAPPQPYLAPPPMQAMQACTPSYLPHQQPLEAKPAELETTLH